MHLDQRRRGALCMRDLVGLMGEEWVGCGMI